MRKTPTLTLHRLSRLDEGALKRVVGGNHDHGDKGDHRHDGWDFFGGPSRFRRRRRQPS